MRRSRAGQLIAATGIALITVGWILGDGLLSDVLALFAFLLLFFVLPLFAAFLSFVERARSEGIDRPNRR